MKNKNNPISTAQSILNRFKVLEKEESISFYGTGFSLGKDFSKVSELKFKQVMNKIDKILSGLLTYTQKDNSFLSQNIKIKILAAIPYTGSPDPFSNEVIYILNLYHLLEEEMKLLNGKKRNKLTQSSKIYNAIQNHYMISPENKLKILKNSSLKDKKKFIDLLETTKEKGVPFTKY